MHAFEDISVRDSDARRQRKIGAYLDQGLEADATLHVLATQGIVKAAHGGLPHENAPHLAVHAPREGGLP